MRYVPIVAKPKPPVVAKKASRPGLPPFRPGQAPAIVGCAVPYGEVAWVPEVGRMQIEPGAFRSFLVGDPLVTARVDHKRGTELATTEDGTLRLEETAAGLMFWLKPSPPSDPLCMAVLGAARRGAVEGASVTFGLDYLPGRSRCAGQLARVRTASISEMTLAITKRPRYARTFAVLDSPQARRRLARLDVGVSR